MSHIIKIDDQLYLDIIKPIDKPRLIELLRERKIYEQTLVIPFPYTEADADWWVKENQKKLVENGHPLSYAIRNQDGLLLGSIGFHSLGVGKDFKAEIGYWLGKPYWGQGIMSKVVKKLCSVGFTQFGLVRITAHIFHFNKGSEMVLLKSGFTQEGYFKKYYKKDGAYYDAKVFAIIKP